MVWGRWKKRERGGRGGGREGRREGEGEGGREREGGVQGEREGERERGGGGREGGRGGKGGRGREKEGGRERERGGGREGGREREGGRVREREGGRVREREGEMDWVGLFGRRRKRRISRTRACTRSTRGADNARSGYVATSESLPPTHTRFPWSGWRVRVKASLCIDAAISYRLRD